MKKLSESLITDGPYSNSTVKLGEPEDILDYPDPYAREIPIIIDGIEQSTDELNLIMTPFEKNGQTLYRLDINLYKKYRNQGLGFKIYKEFLYKYGNIMGYKKFRMNNAEIPAIYKKLANLPGVNMEKYGDDFNLLLATQPWLVNANFLDSLKLTQDKLKDLQIIDMAHILRYFEGKTPTQKRKKLIRFLQMFPAYKTTDFHEMYFRLTKLQARAIQATKQGEDDSPFFKALKQSGFIF